MHSLFTNQMLVLMLYVRIPATLEFIFLGNVSMAKKCLQVNVVFVDVGRVWILIIFAMRNYE